MVQIKEKNEFIDVKELIRKLNHNDLVNSADLYWKNLNIYSDQCFKPFIINESGMLLKHLGILFNLSDFKKNQSVLDFGCGAGWLSNALADCGMNVVGVDISQRAVDLSIAFRELRKPRAVSSVFSKVFDGKVLPFESESFDRIVCFDSFHHVADQSKTLSEFYRVLKPGGIVSFIEPGINHSIQPLSQFEMKTYNVIENDIDMDEITNFAKTHGFNIPIMYIHSPKPFFLKLDFSTKSFFFKIKVLKAHLKALIQQFYSNDCQAFKLVKPGAERLTSVDKALNSYSITNLSVNQVFDGDNVKLIIKIEFLNTGKSIWLHDNSKDGKVNVGISMLDSSLKYIDRDFKRFDLSPVDVNPGESVKRKIDFIINREQYSSNKFQVDLVAENIAWFGDVNVLDKNYIQFK